MESSLRIVPASSKPSASVQSTANSLGLHDTLQYGPRSLAAEVQSEGGLRSRLENWEATQDNLKLTLERNMFGMHAPMRRLMERKIVGTTVHTLSAPQTNVQLDVLMGRDELIDAADVFLGMEAGPAYDVHTQIQKKASS
ncbi:putative proteasome maturation factor ump1 [Psilocybe cubensis]|uniref:Proteasome maturation factor UMP1 n=2 Tax=Psilocybe cubensis TaxID=181762 RepID=A0A8H8CPJ9_PSICU|nr:putative proteasome maturation factor ump1 [Psilocybe cubensis]KAH9486650.1 putative proteasome maturation factor ump1 [Psilocybe cubensis]